MTHVEKVQLRWLIEQLPAESLDRVVDILGKRNPSVCKSSEKIHIELDSEVISVLNRDNSPSV